MCQFFSAISDGKGRVEFFKVEDVVKEMVKENPNKYDWNSHSSIAHFIGLTPEEEDEWNKWEYNPEEDRLSGDSLPAEDDSEEVKRKVRGYLRGKDVAFLRNFYNGNAGSYNSGSHNSGNHNAGSYNAGSYNSGNCNSGTIIGSFCSKKKYFLFNKECNKEEYEQINKINFYWFKLVKWIPWEEMTEEEKEKYPSAKTIKGYLKVREYKEVWAECPSEVLEQIKRLPNFNAKVFREITGIEV